MVNILQEYRGTDLVSDNLSVPASIILFCIVIREHRIVETDFEFSTWI